MVSMELMRRTCEIVCMGKDDWLEIVEVEDVVMVQVWSCAFQWQK